MRKCDGLGAIEFRGKHWGCANLKEIAETVAWLSTSQNWHRSFPDGASELPGRSWSVALLEHGE